MPLKADPVGDSRTYSLNECINFALENSPVMKQMQEKVGISRSKVAEARSGFLPKLTARTSYNYFNADNVVKTRYAPTIVQAVSEHFASGLLQNQALDLGISSITGMAVTEEDILASLAARNGLTPAQQYGVLVNQVKGQLAVTNEDILQSPLMGNNLWRNELNAVVPIFQSGLVYNKYKKSKESVNEAFSDVKAAENNLIYAINQSYQYILLAKDGVRLAQETEDKFKGLLDIVEALYKGDAENVTKLDYLKIKATLGLVRNEVSKVEKSLKLSKAALKRDMGLLDEINIDVVEDGQTYEFIEVDLEDCVEKALMNRPEFDGMDYSILAKKYDIKSTKAENRPKVFLDSQLQHNVDDENYLEPDPIDFRLSVIADIPLFDGFQTRARVSSKKHELEMLKQQKLQLKQEIIYEVTEAVLSLEEAAKRLKETEEAVEAAIENQILARQGFELEIVDSEKVIEAQVLEAKVKTQHLLSIYTYNLAKTRLNKAMGLNYSYSSYNKVEPVEYGDFFLKEKPDSLL